MSHSMLGLVVIAKSQALEGHKLIHAIIVLWPDCAACLGYATRTLKQKQAKDTATNIQSAVCTGLHKAVR